jgi:hypothetical protein
VSILLAEGTMAGFAIAFRASMAEPAFAQHLAYRLREFYGKPEHEPFTDTTDYAQTTVSFPPALALSNVGYLTRSIRDLYKEQLKEEDLLVQNITQKGQKIASDLFVKPTDEQGRLPNINNIWLSFLSAGFKLHAFAFKMRMKTYEFLDDESMNPKGMTGNLLPLHQVLLLQNCIMKCFER